jgi:hypothetical protein
MEAFYQESGRAGRDQLPSTSLLYYGVDDRKRMVDLLNLMLCSCFLSDFFSLTMIYFRNLYYATQVARSHNHQVHKKNQPECP